MLYVHLYISSDKYLIYSNLKSSDVLLILLISSHVLPQSEPVSKSDSSELIFEASKLLRSSELYSSALYAVAVAVNV